MFIFFLFVLAKGKMNIPSMNVASSSLPPKSASRCEIEYDDFKNWQNRNSVIGVTKNGSTWINYLLDSVPILYRRNSQKWLGNDQFSLKKLVMCRFR